MKKVTKTTYSMAIQDMTRYLKADRELLGCCKFVALLGSVREKEHILGYSDLDILFVLKCDSSGGINQNALKSLKNICTLLSKQYPIKISFLTHTEKEFKVYVEYEYLMHYSWGKVLLGNQKEFAAFFKKLLLSKKPNKRELVGQMFNAIMHARFNLVRKYVSFNDFNTKKYEPELLRLFIDNLLEIADWRLISNGVWSSSKKNIVSNIAKISKSPHKGVLSKAFEYRKNWNKRIYGGSELKDFFENSLIFIDDCVAELAKKI